MSHDALSNLLRQKLGDPALYARALTHGSTGEDDYQRLEFLGDRVLNLTVAEMLYLQYPDDAEGRMAHRLNALVNGGTCADVARMIGLPPLLKLGKQAHDDGARDSENVLGDVMEAIIGAIFLDKGFAPARDFVLIHWTPLLNSQEKAPKHPKSALQEWAAASRRGTPFYEVTAKSGPPHSMTFTVTVSLKGLDAVSAEGPSKQAAETKAAEQFLERHA